MEYACSNRAIAMPTPPNWMPALILDITAAAIARSHASVAQRTEQGLPKPLVKPVGLAKALKQQQGKFSQQKGQSAREYMSGGRPLLGGDRRAINRPATVQRPINGACQPASAGAVRQPVGFHPPALPRRCTRLPIHVAPPSADGERRTINRPATVQRPVNGACQPASADAVRQPVGFHPPALPRRCTRLPIHVAPPSDGDRRTINRPATVQRPVNGACQPASAGVVR